MTAPLARATFFARLRPRAVSVPVFIAGVGTVWISARPARGRP